MHDSQLNGSIETCDNDGEYDSVSDSHSKREHQLDECKTQLSTLSHFTLIVIPLPFPITHHTFRTQR